MIESFRVWKLLRRGLPGRLPGLLAGLLVFSNAQAYYRPDETDKFAGKLEMNGIRHEAYRDFPRKWQLITVRYRKDTKEIRFVYGNEKAVSALLSHAKDYPEGSVFAKMAVYSEEDPHFVSSDVPSGTARIQYMVRDKKRYAGTSGWGYALFDDQGKTLPEDPVAKTKACAACHNLVPDLGYVFSEPVRFLFPSWKGSGPLGLVKLPFHQAGRAALPPALAAALPAGMESIWLVGPGALKEIFQGTLDEMVPLLVKEARKKKAPAALVSPDGGKFSLVWGENAKGKCGKDMLFHRVTTGMAAPGEGKQASLQADQFCDTSRPE